MKNYLFTRASISNNVEGLLDFDKDVICIALNKLVRSSYYDICTVDNLAKVLRVSKNENGYDLLRLMHCIHYSEMGESVADELMEKTFQYLGVTPNVIDVIMNTEEDSENTSTKAYAKRASIANRIPHFSKSQRKLGINILGWKG
jgi:hypothetical protein